MNDKEIATRFKIPAEMPFLQAICWQIANVKNLTFPEMLCRYESGWHYWGVLGEPNSEELAFIQQISQHYQSWLVAELLSIGQPQKNEKRVNFQPMFKREIHQKILTVLSHLNVEFLQECRAYFGGGTLVSMEHGEYRLSRDIDFMCPMDGGYSLLRRKVAEAGYDAIFANRERIFIPNDIQSNQYGIRFPVIVDRTTIKFEMVCEGRIQFGEPNYPNWSPVPCLNQIDIIAEKLLANADRWPSDRVNSRDLIDLAIQRLASPIPQQAIDKAEAAYQVMEPLNRAIEYFQERPDYREKCYNLLSIAEPDRVINGIDLLAQDLGREITVRTFSETISPFPITDESQM
ncbi:nucleotidyl transferase AbiEii/AbiGii toxin family protein [Microcoleus sp. herbarium14]|uniref:nucleotidyl transferase AbiEii/AbiGii toxin family protein n=1 Tax=Microcoleus sp. herbarium14 TaxID=3055439 RepID=UPI002FD21B44